MISGLLLGSTLVPAAHAAEGVSFSEDVLPVLKRHCVICHLPGDEQGELSLHPDAYGNLASAPSSQSPLVRVKPRSAESSYLYHKLKGTQDAVGGSGALMPFQRDALDEAQIEMIRLWIEQGAKRN